MTPSEPKASPRRRWPWIVLAFVAGMLIMGAIAFLLTNIQTRKAEAIEFPLKTVEIAEDELDPAVWGQNFPRVRLVQEDGDRRQQNALRGLGAVRQAGGISHAEADMGRLCVQRRFQ